jgi:serine phosphatase RsbU (regulator of sigma subunit)
VQQAFLPSGPPVFPGYEFFSFYRAANHIGGDYYDYVGLPQGRLAVVVADVVGHGVAAAMLMAKLSAEVRFCLASEPDPATAVTMLNQRLCQLDLNRFVTLVMVVLDPHTHQAAIINAGHMAPLYRRASGALEEPSKAEAGIPIGIADGMKFAKTTITLAPGESLTLYTDGLNEATDSAHKQYTIERLKGNVKAAGNSPREIGQLLVDGVQSHLAGGSQDDDMCLVVIQRT